jgi:predicted dehydrogenase
MGRIHAKDLVALPGVDVTAVCAANLSDATGLNDEVLGGRAAIYGDFDDMLRKSELDTLVVGIPPGAHNGQVEAAAAKGIHLFMEKPIAIDLARGSSMVKAVEKSGVVAHVGYHMRFGVAVERLKRMIESGEAGRPTLLDCRYACNSLHSPWWRDVTMCGGQVVEQAIHLYDLALHLLGKPTAVTGFAANLVHGDVPGYTVEDTSTAAIRFETGALASITATNCAVPGQWVASTTVVCERLTAHLTDQNHATFVYTSEDPVRSTRIASNRDVYAREINAFIGAIRGKAVQCATIQEGLLGLQMVRGVVSSSEAGGKPIPLQSR